MIITGLTTVLQEEVTPNLSSILQHPSLQSSYPQKRHISDTRGSPKLKTHPYKTTIYIQRPYSGDAQGVLHHPEKAVRCEDLT